MIRFHTLIRKEFLRLLVVQRLQNDILSLGQADHLHQLVISRAFQLCFCDFTLFGRYCFVLRVNDGFQLDVIPLVKYAMQIRLKLAFFFF